MFVNLRTSTKLIILCAMFLLVVVTTTYSLVAEKQLAIDFARKELVGARYLAALRPLYKIILANPPIDVSAAPKSGLADDVIAKLSASQRDAGTQLHTTELAQELSEALRRWSSESGDSDAYTHALDALSDAGQLISRIADDSNLALDPDLGSYHLQDLVTRRLPSFFRHLAEVELLFHQAGSGEAPPAEQRARFQILQGLLRSVLQDIGASLRAAYRGSPDGSLKQVLDDEFSAMMSRTNSYLDNLRTRIAEGNIGVPRPTSNRPYRNVVEGATAAWAAAQSELDRLLRERIDSLTWKLTLSLALTGTLAGLSILIALMTYRHIAEPLGRLENVATKVSETKDYSLRMDYAGKNEIGRLAAAFNDMLAELSSARERERSEQSELMRVSRLTTMGAMTASIAHEINQPLAAIAANANASQRWLSKPIPNLDEARLALKKIDTDAHRASQVIGSVRAMFRNDNTEKAAATIDEIIKEVIALVQGELRKHGVTARIDLHDDLPNVIGDRIRLLQMFLNLTRNAIEAMSLVADRERILTIKSELHPHEGLLVTVQDTGPGFDSNDGERMFDAFYTTKTDGMGMGLSICRRIAEGHGGRLWASPVTPHGSAFHVVLPTA